MRRQVNSVISFSQFCQSDAEQSYKSTNSGGYETDCRNVKPVIETCNPENYNSQFAQG